MNFGTIPNQRSLFPHLVPGAARYQAMESEYAGQGKSSVHGRTTGRFVRLCGGRCCNFPYSVQHHKNGFKNIKAHKFAVIYSLNGDILTAGQIFRPPRIAVGTASLNRLPCLDETISSARFNRKSIITPVRELQLFSFRHGLKIQGHHRE